jgi:hypothetical protein
MKSGQVKRVKEKAICYINFGRRKIKHILYYCRVSILLNIFFTGWKVLKDAIHRLEDDLPACTVTFY